MVLKAVSERLKRQIFIFFRDWVRKIDLVLKHWANKGSEKISLVVRNPVKLTATVLRHHRSLEQTRWPLLSISMRPVQTYYFFRNLQSCTMHIYCVNMLGNPPPHLKSSVFCHRLRFKAHVWRNVFILSGTGFVRNEYKLIVSKCVTFFIFFW
jgi:hypothetical protein